MAAKTPPIYYAGNGNGNDNDNDQPAAVNGNAAYYRDHYHSANNALDPPASSSGAAVQQDFYAPTASSSFSYNNNLDHQDHLYAPAPTRPTGKFREEWDASQRGSSIINGPIPRGIPTNNMSSIQRSNSSAGGSITGGPSAGGTMMDGSSSIQVSRSNTLKKKSSMRRSGSLRRAGSRRSMKAGSVRSLALQSNADEDETHNAFYCPVPTSGNPTEALANRFQCTFLFCLSVPDMTTFPCAKV